VSEEAAGGTDPSDADPWAAAQGQVGAAPPPVWGPPASAGSPSSPIDQPPSADAPSPGWSQAAPGNGEAPDGPRGARHSLPPGWSAAPPYGPPPDPPSAEPHGSPSGPPAYGTQPSGYGTQPYGEAIPPSGPGSDRYGWPGGRSRRGRPVYGGAGGPFGPAQSGRYGRRVAGLRRPVANPNRNIIWLLAGALTLGLLYPVPALICWIRAGRYRSPKITQPPARAWFVWAIVFTLLTVGCYGGLIAVGNSENNAPSSDGGGIPTKSVHVSLGTTVALTAEDSPHDGSGVVPIELTMGDLRRRPHSGIKDVNLTVAAKVCSTAAAIDPLAAVEVVSLVTKDGTAIDASADWDLPTSFYTTLGPHSCLSGTVGYRLPTGATPGALSYDSFVSDIVYWTVG
jgi:hypothetical protein